MICFVGWLVFVGICVLLPRFVCLVVFDWLVGSGLYIFLFLGYLMLGSGWLIWYFQVYWLVVWGFWLVFSTVIVWWLCGFGIPVFCLLL